MNPLLRNLWQVVALGIILSAGVVSGTQDDDDTSPAEEIPANPVGFDESIIDQIVFRTNQRVAVQRGGPVVNGRVLVDQQLKTLLDGLVEDCQLTDVQQQKLTLAARGDMKRFFDQIEDARKKFAAVKNDQNRAIDLLRELTPLQQQFSKGLFGDDSLFIKTLRKTLTEEQHARHEALMRDGRRTLYRAAINTSLDGLGNGIILRPEQRDALRKLLLDQTAPPLQFGQYDRQVIMLKLSNLPSEKLREVLDKNQWKLLQPRLLEASGTEDYLARFGVIEQPKYSTVIIRSKRTVVESPPVDSAQPD